MSNAFKIMRDRLEYECNCFAALTGRDFSIPETSVSMCAERNNTVPNEQLIMRDRPRLISLEGNIGAGKSTMIEHMKSVFQDREDIVFLQEPVDLWESVTQDDKNMIQLFYDDPRKYAFAFQVLAFTSRLRLIREEIKKANSIGTVKTIVMERSLEADKEIFAKMLYDEGKMESCEYQIYQMMSYDGLRECSVDGIIWLTTEADECARRIRTRSRDGEEGISLRYLEQCEIYHKQWLGADLGFVFRIDDDKFVGRTTESGATPLVEDEEQNWEEVYPTGEPLDWNLFEIFLLG